MTMADESDGILSVKYLSTYTIHTVRAKSLEETS